MDLLLKFLILGGKYLTKITTQSIMEAYKRSVQLGRTINSQLDQTLNVACNQENILDLYNYNLEELSSQYPHIHLAFISEKHREEFEKYLREARQIINRNVVKANKSLQTFQQADKTKHANKNKKINLVENRINNIKTDVKLTATVSLPELALIDEQNTEIDHQVNYVTSVDSRIADFKHIYDMDHMRKQSAKNLLVDPKISGENQKALIQVKTQKSTASLSSLHSVKNSPYALDSFKKLEYKISDRYQKTKEKNSEKMFYKKLRDVEKEIAECAKLIECAWKHFEVSEEINESRRLAEIMSKILISVKATSELMNVNDENFREFERYQKLKNVKVQTDEAAALQDANTLAFDNLVRKLTQKNLLGSIFLPTHHVQNQENLVSIPMLQMRPRYEDIEEKTKLIDVNQRAFDTHEKTLKYTNVISPRSSTGRKSNETTNRHSRKMHKDIPSSQSYSTAIFAANTKITKSKKNNKGFVNFSSKKSSRTMQETKRKRRSHASAEEASEEYKILPGTLLHSVEASEFAVDEKLDSLIEQLLVDIQNDKEMSKKTHDFNLESAAEESVMSPLQESALDIKQKKQDLIEMLAPLRSNVLPKCVHDLNLCKIRPTGCDHRFVMTDTIQSMKSPFNPKVFEMKPKMFNDTDDASCMYCSEDMHRLQFEDKADNASVFSLENAMKNSGTIKQVYETPSKSFSVTELVPGKKINVELTENVVPDIEIEVISPDNNHTVSCVEIRRETDKPVPKHPVPIEAQVWPEPKDVSKTNDENFWERVKMARSKENCLQNLKHQVVKSVSQTSTKQSDTQSISPLPMVNNNGKGSTYKMHKEPVTIGHKKSFHSINKNTDKNKMETPTKNMTPAVLEKGQKKVMNDQRTLNYLTVESKKRLNFRPNASNGNVQNTSVISTTNTTLDNSSSIYEREKDTEIHLAEKIKDLVRAIDMLNQREQETIGNIDKKLSDCIEKLMEVEKNINQKSSFEIKSWSKPKLEMPKKQGIRKENITNIVSNDHDAVELLSITSQNMVDDYKRDLNTLSAQEHTLVSKLKNLIQNIEKLDDFDNQKILTFKKTLQSCLEKLHSSEAFANFLGENKIDKSSLKEDSRPVLTLTPNSIQDVIPTEIFPNVYNQKDTPSCKEKQILKENPPNPSGLTVVDVKEINKSEERSVIQMTSSKLNQTNVPLVIKDVTNVPKLTQRDKGGNNKINDGSEDTLLEVDIELNDLRRDDSNDIEVEISNKMKQLSKVAEIDISQNLPAVQKSKSTPAVNSEDKLNTDQNSSLRFNISGGRRNVLNMGKSGTVNLKVSARLQGRIYPDGFKSKVTDKIDVKKLQAMSDKLSRSTRERKVSSIPPNPSRRKQMLKLNANQMLKVQQTKTVSPFREPVRTPVIQETTIEEFTKSLENLRKIADSYLGQLDEPLVFKESQKIIAKDCAEVKSARRAENLRRKQRHGVKVSDPDTITPSIEKKPDIKVDNVKISQATEKLTLEDKKLIDSELSEKAAKQAKVESVDRNKKAAVSEKIAAANKVTLSPKDEVKAEEHSFNQKLDIKTTEDQKLAKLAETGEYVLSNEGIRKKEDVKIVEAEKNDKHVIKVSKEKPSTVSTQLLKPTVSILPSGAEDVIQKINKAQEPKRANSDMKKLDAYKTVTEQVKIINAQTSENIKTENMSAQNKHEAEERKNTNNVPELDKETTKGKTETNILEIKPSKHAQVLASHARESTDSQGLNDILSKLELPVEKVKAADDRFTNEEQIILPPTESIKDAINEDVIQNVAKPEVQSSDFKEKEAKPIVKTTTENVSVKKEIKTVLGSSKVTDKEEMKLTVLKEKQAKPSVISSDRIPSNHYGTVKNRFEPILESSKVEDNKETMELSDVKEKAAKPTVESSKVEDKKETMSDVKEKDTTPTIISSNDYSPTKNNVSVKGRFESMLDSSKVKDKKETMILANDLEQQTRPIVKSNSYSPTKDNVSVKTRSESILESSKVEDKKETKPDFKENETKPNVISSRSYLPAKDNVSVKKRFESILESSKVEDKKETVEMKLAEQVNTLRENAMTNQKEAKPIVTSSNTSPTVDNVSVENRFEAILEKSKVDNKKTVEMLIAEHVHKLHKEVMKNPIDNKEKEVKPVERSSNTFPPTKNIISAKNRFEAILEKSKVEDKKQTIEVKLAEQVKTLREEVTSNFVPLELPQVPSSPPASTPKDDVVSVATKSTYSLKKAFIKEKEPKHHFPCSAYDNLSLDEKSVTEKTSKVESSETTENAVSASKIPSPKSKIPRFEMTKTALKQENQELPDIIKVDINPHAGQCHKDLSTGIPYRIGSLYNNKPAPTTKFDSINEARARIGVKKETPKINIDSKKIRITNKQISDQFTPTSIQSDTKSPKPWLNNSSLKSKEKVTLKFQKLESGPERKLSKLNAFECQLKKPKPPSPTNTVKRTSVDSMLPNLIPEIVPPGAPKQTPEIRVVNVIKSNLRPKESKIVKPPSPATEATKDEDQTVKEEVKKKPMLKPYPETSAQLAAMKQAEDAPEPSVADVASTNFEDLESTHTSKDLIEEFHKDGHNDVKDKQEIHLERPKSGQSVSMQKTESKKDMKQEDKQIPEVKEKVEEVSIQASSSLKDESLKSVNEETEIVVLHKNVNSKMDKTGEGKSILKAIKVSDDDIQIRPIRACERECNLLRLIALDRKVKERELHEDVPKKKDMTLVNVVEELRQKKINIKVKPSEQSKPSPSNASSVGQTSNSLSKKSISSSKTANTQKNDIEQDTSVKSNSATTKSKVDHGKTTTVKDAKVAPETKYTRLHMTSTDVNLRRSTAKKNEPKIETKIENGQVKKIVRMPPRPLPPRLPLAEYFADNSTARKPKIVISKTPDISDQSITASLPSINEIKIQISEHSSKYGRLGPKNLLPEVSPAIKYNPIVVPTPTRSQMKERLTKFAQKIRIANEKSAAKQKDVVEPVKEKSSNESSLNKVTTVRYMPYAMRKNDVFEMHKTMSSVISSNTKKDMYVKMTKNKDVDHKEKTKGDKVIIKCEPKPKTALKKFQEDQEQNLRKTINVGRKLNFNYSKSPTRSSLEKSQKGTASSNLTNFRVFKKEMSTFTANAYQDRDRTNQEEKISLTEMKEKIIKHLIKKNCSGKDTNVERDRANLITPDSAIDCGDDYFESASQNIWKWRQITSNDQLYRSNWTADSRHKHLKITSSDSKYVVY